jgi:hypothetical protein
MVPSCRRQTAIQSIELTCRLKLSAQCGFKRRRFLGPTPNSEFVEWTWTDPAPSCFSSRRPDPVQFEGDQHPEDELKNVFVRATVVTMAFAASVFVIHLVR